MSMWFDEGYVSFAGGCSSSAAMVLRRIRRDRLVGLDLSAVPLEVRRGISEMQRSVSRACDRLARDLYEAGGQYVYEVVQNADDNRSVGGKKFATKSKQNEIKLK